MNIPLLLLLLFCVIAFLWYYLWNFYITILCSDIEVFYQHVYTQLACKAKLLIRAIIFETLGLIHYSKSIQIFKIGLFTKIVSVMLTESHSLH